MARKTAFQIKRTSDKKSKVSQIFKKLRPIQEKKERMQQILDILDEEDINVNTPDINRLHNNYRILKQTNNKFISMERTLFERANPF